MKKLFHHEEISIDTPVYIEGDDYNHLSKALRVRIGEHFVVEDSTQVEYNCEVTEVSKHQVTLIPSSIFERENLSSRKIILYFPILKGDKTEYLIQKSTEIGVDAFVPIITKNTVVDIKDNKEKKIRRWQTVAREASMQSGRKGLPPVMNPEPIASITKISDGELGVVGYFSSTSLKSILSNLEEYHTIKVIVGPEGDLTEHEIELLTEKGFVAVNIADNILRSETAGIMFASLLSFLR